MHVRSPAPSKSKPSQTCRLILFRNAYCFAWIIVLVGGHLVAAAQTLNLSFRPPVGAVVEINRERVINTVTKQTAQFDVENTVSLMRFAACPDGYRVSEVAKEMARTVDGKPFDNPMHKFLVGRTNTLIVSPDGELLRTEDRDNLIEELKAFFPTNAYALLERELGGERPYILEKERWDRNVQRFVGQTLKQGDVWKESVALPSARNRTPQKAHRANRVEKVEPSGATTLVTIVTFQSSEPGEIDDLDSTQLNMEDGIKFIRKQPLRMPFWRTIHRRTFEAMTMLPIHDERVWRGSEWKSTEWALITERQVEAYKRLK